MRYLLVLILLLGCSGDDNNPTVPYADLLDRMPAEGECPSWSTSELWDDVDVYSYNTGFWLSSWWIDTSTHSTITGLGLREDWVTQVLGELTLFYIGELETQIWFHPTTTWGGAYEAGEVDIHLWVGEKKHVLLAQSYRDGSWYATLPLDSPVIQEVLLALRHGVPIRYGDATWANEWAFSRAVTAWECALEEIGVDE